MKRAIFIYLIIFINICQSINAQDFYVNPLMGNDDNKGTIENPYKTIEKAVQKANEITGLGSINIKLFPGVYVLFDKVFINPVRILENNNRFTIEALTMPDDSSWTPEKMPIIQSISSNNSETQFSHSVGFLISTNNVSIRGLKFIGNPNPLVPYYYPITRENPSLKNLEVSQCYFIAEKNSSSIQGAVWAHGHEITVEYCVFYNCRNAILLFDNINKCSIKNNLIYGAYESAVWIGDNDANFEFSKNVISSCNFIIVKGSNYKHRYTLSDCVFIGNRNFVGHWSETDDGISISRENDCVESNILRTGEVKLVEREKEYYPNDYLHLSSNSVGYNLNVGIFKKNKNK